MELKPIQTGSESGVNALTDPASISKIRTIKDPQQQADAVASQMERAFFSMMVKAMRQTVPEGGLLGKGLGGDMYVEMLDQQLVEMASTPRDPRFHEALVREIMNKPQGAQQAMNRLGEATASASQSSAKDQ